MMNTFKNEPDLLKYLENVFDAELNLYIQNRVLQRMQNTYRRLGKSRKIICPGRRTSDVSIGATIIFTGVVCGILSFAVTLIITLLSCKNFFDFINAVWTALVLGVIGAAVLGILFGSFLGSVRKKRHQKDLDYQYAAETEKYRNSLEQENKRVRDENVQKARLSKDIALLNTGIAKSKENLQLMYQYDILDQEYRNIYAVSSILGYLEKGRTHCLTFNERTGDQGAYNIYENERRLDRIITNTDEILERLDQVIQTQNILAEGLQNAEKLIASLSQGVSEFVYSAGNRLKNIENSQALISYHTERIASETQMLAWMAMMF